MRDGPTASVIIPTYNRAGTLARAIESVLRQTLDDLELLVVDDGSTDDTPLVLEGFSDGRLVYLRHPHNRGQSAARNTGIRASNGTFIAFLDSDDLWQPTALARQVDALKASPPTTGVAVCGRIKVDETSGTRREVMPQFEGEIFEQTLALKWVPSTVTLLVKSELLRETMFDEMLPTLEELDLCIRLSQKTQFAAVRVPLVVIFEHRGPRVSTAGKEAMAWRRMLHSHSQHLTQRPKVRAQYHYRAFLGYYQAGDLRSARSELWRSLRVDPRGLRHWLRLVSLLFGNRLHALARKVYSGYGAGHA